MSNNLPRDITRALTRVRKAQAAHRAKRLRFLAAMQEAGHIPQHVTSADLDLRSFGMVYYKSWVNEN